MALHDPHPLFSRLQVVVIIEACVCVCVREGEGDREREGEGWLILAGLFYAFIHTLHQSSTGLYASFA